MGNRTIDLNIWSYYLIEEVIILSEQLQMKYWAYHLRTVRPIFPIIDRDKAIIMNSDILKRVHFDEKFLITWGLEKFGKNWQWGMENEWIPSITRNPRRSERSEKNEEAWPRLMWCDRRELLSIYIYILYKFLRKSNLCS